MEATSTKKDFSNSEIEQLNRILASSIFNNSRILSGFLEFVVTETRAGREREIKEFTIAVHVLSRHGNPFTKHGRSMNLLG